MRIRNPKESEFETVYQFVSKCKPLERHSVHFYKIMLRYFGDTSFVAMDKGKIRGFVLGFVSQTQKKTFFLWQIGISPAMQGKGIGQRLLEAIERRIKNKSIKRIELTVDPKNKPSQRLFEKNGYSVISQKEDQIIKIKNKKAVKNYYGPGAHFILYEKIL